jgi:muramoyltetrapeptide carboxypeptidase
MKNGYLSGLDEARAKDVMEAFIDPAIDGIFCARGGYGATRILPLLDYAKIAKHPKLFVGYSDITALHTVFNQRCSFITVHGPMPSTGYHLMDYYSLERLAGVLFKSNPPGLVSNPLDEELKMISPGISSGLIIGGNLSVLVATLGSPYEIDTKDKILFIEDVEERPYQIDRNLTALALAGKFRDCSGILLGTFTECQETEMEPDSTLTIEEIVEQIILPYQKPTLGNFRCGHSYPMITIPMGSLAHIDADLGTVEFLKY